MNKIEVAIIGDYGNPGDMAGFLARLTQRGHKIKTMQDLMKLYDKGASSQFVEAIAGLPHGTIKRFTPITIAIVGASRRFLAQARTNQVGFNYVSASLQYSDYSSDAQFVVPYSVMAKDHEFKIHKRSCPIAAKLKSSYGNRILDAKWDMHKQLFFDAMISIKGIDRIGLLNEVTQVISEELNVNIHKVIISCEEGIFDGSLELKIHDRNDVKNIIDKLKKINGLQEIKQIV